MITVATAQMRQLGSARFPPKLVSNGVRAALHRAGFWADDPGRADNEGAH